jgi:PII-like signaling protein
MAVEFEKITFLKIYTGEDVMLDDQPLYKAIINEARRLQLAGGTVIKGIEGYATKLRGVGRAINYFVSGNANYPIIIEIVDTREKLETILPYLEKNVTNGLVILEESEYLVTDYTRKRKAERETLLAQQNED